MADLQPVSEQTCNAIHWCAPFFNFSGYARLNRDLSMGLNRDGFPLSIMPLETDLAYLESLRTQQSLWARWAHLLEQSAKPGGILLCSLLPTGFPSIVAANVRFNARVGLTMFETDRLPNGWLEACNVMDEIWVPSTFNVETFCRGGVSRDRLQVIPYGIDLGAWDPKVSPLLIPGRRAINFLAVFEWTLRKGWDILVEGFARAFHRDDDVSLTLLTRRPSNDTTPIVQQIDRHLSSRGLVLKETPPMLLLEKPLPDTAMPALYAAATAVLLPTRGEGWGLPIMEAMAMEKPPVATAWGAHMDFLDDKVGWEIPIEKLDPVAPAQTRLFPLYGADHQWATPSLEAFVAILKLLAQRPELAVSKGKIGRARLAEQWQPARSTEWIKNRVAYVLAERRPKPNNF